MSFLQPAVLIAIPVIALPIIIHLINQRRFQNVPWAAMQFLLTASRMSRGYARLRQWLILAARTIAIAGLIFAISRPLSSGWLGLAGGGRVDTTIILLDRSPSMLQAGPGGVTKLQAGLDQLAESLGKLRSNRYVLIDSANESAMEIESPDLLLELPEAMPVSQSADLPSMLEVADDYVRANRPSRCEVWICSDVRRHDWKDESGRWDAIRASLQELPQMVRFHLLAYAETVTTNRSLSVTKVRSVTGHSVLGNSVTGDSDSEGNVTADSVSADTVSADTVSADTVSGADGPHLILSLRIEQADPVEGQQTIPIQLELDGARSEFTAEMTGTELDLLNHVIPLGEAQTRGWGRVSIPSDASPADNEFYFVYDKSIDRKTVIVADDPETVRPLEFAASVSADPEISCLTTVITPEQVAGTSMQEVSLLLWQSALPGAGDPARPVVQALLDRGGQAIFLPPESPTDAEFAGLSWTAWQQQTNVPVTTWVDDQDLLANTASGAALPVGELKVSRYCELRGDRSALATLDGGAPLLARAMTDQRNVYFLATTSSRRDSSLARDGVVLYALIHRALAAGAQSLGNTRQFIAGEIAAEQAGGWTRLAGNPDALSNTYAQHAGVYRFEDQLLAVNRDPREDAITIVPRQRVAALFEGLDFDRVDDQAGSGASLIQEIWRLFLILMMIALLLEAVLCIPRRAAAATAPSGHEVMG